MQEFFRDLLFENDGAYTLFGTKPVSAFLIEEPLTEEEKGSVESIFCISFGRRKA
jgi:hypothetical protein